MANEKGKGILTEAELRVMNALWSMEENKGTINDILGCYDDPKPAYTTVSTFVKILQTKGYIESEKIAGVKTLMFRALITHDEYASRVLTDVKRTIFNGSLKTLASCLISDEKISRSELEEIIKMIEEQTL